MQCIRSIRDRRHVRHGLLTDEVTEQVLVAPAAVELVAVATIPPPVASPIQFDGRGENGDLAEWIAESLKRRLAGRFGDERAPDQEAVAFEHWVSISTSTDSSVLAGALHEAPEVVGQHCMSVVEEQRKAQAAAGRRMCGFLKANIRVWNCEELARSDTYARQNPERVYTKPTCLQYRVRSLQFQYTILLEAKPVPRVK